VKSRFYSGSFPLCRLDTECRGYGLSNSELNEAQGVLLSSLIESDPYEVVVFSDYDKGVFSGMDPFIRKLPDSTISIVDPKGAPLERWRGCTIIKPNASEARIISGSEDWREQCLHFMRATECQAVVITQAGDGVVGNVMGSWFEYRPSSITAPKSVIGAGDAFVAFLAMCMAHSIDIREAVEIAFKACSSYVLKTRNSPIYPYEIESGKRVRPESLRDRDFRLAFANGCFDILHPGHLEMLAFAKGRADRLVVALNSDASVAMQKKPHPMVNGLSFRSEMVLALGCVDFVLSFDEETPYDLIKVVRPDILVKGSDWPNPVGSDIVKEVCSFGLVGGHSTTEIIRRISSLNHI
jgi:D-beta-D-heptose 7-phosphate kinase/D-beta-D-heptose 1-phosphate adenosyltransferase